MCANVVQSLPSPRATAATARGTGPGRVGRLGAFAWELTRFAEVLFGDFLEADNSELPDLDTVLDLLDRAVPGEDPRDFVDVRDAMEVRLPTKWTKSQQSHVSRVSHLNDDRNDHGLAPVGRGHPLSHHLARLLRQLVQIIDAIVHGCLKR